MGQAGVRHTRHEVHLGQAALGHLVPGHDFAVAVAHDLHVDALVIGVGIAVVSPEECADAHFVPGGGEGLHAVRRDPDDLLGAQFIGGLIAQLLIGEGLKGDAAALLVLAHQDRETPQFVPGGDDALRRQQQDGGGAVDDILRVADALQQGVLLVDKRGGQLRGVDLAVAHGHELVAVVGEVRLYQLFGVVDDADGGDGVQSQVGPHQQGLGVCVADAADAAASVEVR